MCIKIKHASLQHSAGPSHTRSWTVPDKREVTFKLRTFLDIPAYIPVRPCLVRHHYIAAIPCYIERWCVVDETLTYTNWLFRLLISGKLALLTCGVCPIFHSELKSLVVTLQVEPYRIWSCDMVNFEDNMKP